MRLTGDGGKGSGRRKALVSKQRMDWGWELIDPKTTPERKEEIKRLIKRTDDPQQRESSAKITDPEEYR